MPLFLFIFDFITYIHSFNHNTFIHLYSLKLLSSLSLLLREKKDYDREKDGGHLGGGGFLFFYLFANMYVHVNPENLNLRLLQITKYRIYILKHTDSSKRNSLGLN